VQYLLVPDAGAARRLRRLLCQGGARTGVIVGTWIELLEHACANYLVPPADNDWETDLATALRALPGAFWSRSLEVATTDTATAVWTSARELLLASAPGEFPAPDPNAGLSERAHRHLTDLAKLVEQLDGEGNRKLPPDMYAMQALLDTPDEFAIRKTHVYKVTDKPRLTAWQSLVIDKWNVAAATEPLSELQALLETAVSPAPAAESDSLLHAMQSSLYAGGNPRPLDDTAQWVGVRDDLQEAEVAAGMAQQLIDSGVEPRKIGLLLPTDERYYQVTQDAFDYAGLPLSGLPQPETQRDLGVETVFNFLVCKQRPAPRMALAAFLTSPLMPWSREIGLRLAQTVMDGNYSLTTPEHADKQAAAMLELLRTRHNSPADLSTALEQLSELLPPDTDEDPHPARARTAIDSLRERLVNMQRLDWNALRALVTPAAVTLGDAIEYTQEGITVWLEEQTSWRPVDHLLVLGFSDRHYPRLPGYSPVFFPEDLRAINAACGIELDTNEALLRRRRAVFMSQLAATSASVSFLIPRRDALGDPLAPASSLLFMAGACEGIDAPDDLVLDVDARAAREQIRHLALAERATATPPRSLDASHLALGRNLLELRANEDGSAKPQSPSRLENLIVSPLGWLLGQIYAEPREWQPDELDVLLKGSIAHLVFEGLFPKEQPAPDSEEIRERVPDLFAGVIRRIAPFLRAPAWHVERRHLQREIFEAALAWRDVLIGLDATVVDVEFWLAGQLHGHTIHGQVDALLALPDNRLFVIDFKKSSSSNRQPRMDKGYDAQASLYRTMLETGGPKDDELGRIVEFIHGAESIGVGYFMMNDRRLLADRVVPGAESLPGWVSFEGPVSAGAMEILQRRFDEAARGEVLLNAIDDERAFERCMGIKPYAFDNTPLVRLFMRPEGAGGAA